MAEEKKSNKVIETIGDVVTAIILVFAVVFTALTLTSLNSESGLPNIGGNFLFSVQSDSMEPVFYTGDLLLVKEYEGQDLEVGDIVSFRSIEDGQYIINTHRIMEVHDVGGIKTYSTKGDNTPGYDATDVVESEVVGVYCPKSEQDADGNGGTRIKGLGTVIDFVKGTGKTGEKWTLKLNEGTPDERHLNLSFLFFIILPLALIFLFQIYKFIVALNDAKKEKLMEEVAENAELSEELKKKAVEEYLAKQAAEEEAIKKAAVEEYLAKQAAEEAAKKAAEETVEETAQETADTDKTEN